MSNIFKDKYTIYCPICKHSIKEIRYISLFMYKQRCNNCGAEFIIHRVNKELLHKEN